MNKDFEFKKKSKTLTDSYDKELDKKMSVLKQINIIEKKKRDLFTSNQLTEESMKKAYIMNRSKINLSIYLYVFSAITVNVIFYKNSVRLVKKIFNLNGFWPIHFATFVPLTYANFNLIAVWEASVQNILLKNDLKLIKEKYF